jgi:hypothetical protein
MTKKYLIIGIVLVILIGAGSFYLGMQYEKNQKRSMAGNFQAFSGTGINGQRRTTNQNGGFTVGDIASKDDKSITVKLANGSSKIVFLGDSTKVNKTADGTLDDLQVGTGVMITGISNQDGSITAQSIQIRPSISNQDGQNPQQQPPAN